MDKRTGDRVPGILRELHRGDAGMNRMLNYISVLADLAKERRETVTEGESKMVQCDRIYGEHGVVAGVRTGFADGTRVDLTADEVLRIAECARIVGAAK